MTFEAYKNAPQSAKEVVEKLNKSIDKAYNETAPTHPEAEADKRLFDRLVVEWRKGDIDYDEFKNKIDMLSMGDASVVFETLPEIIQAVSCLPISDDRKKYYLSHENEHMLEAVKLGLKATYGLEFHKLDDGGYHITPFVSVQYPKNMSFEEYKKHYEKTAGAPEELSDDDQTTLNNF